ncbi:MAG: helix-turn-helix transcriptional regulator [Methylococcales bacterium]
MREKANIIPNEVVAAIIKQNMTPLQAWREYLQVSQQELAVRLGISEMQMLAWEKQPELHKANLKKVAAALRLNVEQLNI